MRTVTSWFILLAPIAILLADGLVWWWCGVECTITNVVREWAEKSHWPETLFVIGTLVLYFHLFRNFPECWIWGR